MPRNISGTAWDIVSKIIGEMWKGVRTYLRISVLVDKVEGHSDGTTQRAESERVDLGVDEVLDTVPAEGPAKAAEVDHDDGAHGSVLLAGGLDRSLLVDFVVDEEEDRHV
jgi:hypothetical protein